MLHSPNLVSHGGAGKGEEEQLLPHLGDTTCGVGPSIGKLLYDRQRRSRGEIKEDVDGFPGVRKTEVRQ